jgi:hypothetical protein
VTTVTFSNDVCSTFTMMSSRTLLSDHVSIENGNKENIIQERGASDHYWDGSAAGLRQQGSGKGRRWYEVVHNITASHRRSKKK